MLLLPQLMTVTTTFCLVLAFAVAQPVHGQTNQEKYDAAKLLFAEGVALARAKSVQTAIPKFEQARLVYQEIKAQQEEAISLGWLGYINYSLGYKQKALDYFAQSLPLRRAVGDISGEAQTLNDIGKVYSDLGENQQALKYLNESLPLRRAVGDKSGEAYTLKNIGAVYFDLSENQQALKFFIESLLPARAVGDKDIEAQTLTSVGAVYFQLGDKQQALKFYNESLPLARTVGNKDCEANTLHNIGVVYSNLGENQQALNFYNESLLLFRAIGEESREGQTLKDIGTVYSNLGDKQQALKYYNEALTLHRAVGDKADQIFVEAMTLADAGTAESMVASLQKLEQARRFFQEINAQQKESICLGYLGRINNSLGNKQKAVDYYAQAIRLFRAIGDKNTEAATLTNIGAIYSELGDKQQALKYFNEALPLFRAISDKGGEAQVLTNIGVVYDDLGEKQEALKFYTEALLLRRAIGDKGNEAFMLKVIGGVYSAIGDKQQALKYFNDSLLLSRTIGDKSGEGQMLKSIGVIYGKLGEKQQELKYFNEALRLFRLVGDKRNETMTLTNIGEVYNNLGEQQQALKYFNEVLTLLQAVGDKGDLARTLSNIGLVYSALGEKQQALKFYSEALLLRRAVGDKSGEANTLVNMGVVYCESGEQQQALKFYNESLNLFRSVVDKRGEASTLNNIGGVYSEMGESQQALKFYNESLALHHAVGDKGDEAITLANIGAIYKNLGNRQQALKFFNESLTLSRATGNKRAEGSALNNIGSVYSESGVDQQALKFYNDSLTIARVIDDKRSEASSLNNIGVVYGALGDREQALKFYDEALQLSRAVDYKSGETTTLNNFFYSWASDNPRLSVFYGKQSANIYHALRSNVRGLDKDIQQTFLKSIDGLYRRLANALLAQGRFTEAQQVLNAFKDQQYFDFNSNIQAAPLALTLRESELLTTFNQRLDCIVAVIRQLEGYKRTIGERVPNNSETQQIQIFEADLKAAKGDYLAFLKQAKIDFTALPSDKDNVGEIADTRKMQTALRELQSQTGQKAIAIYTLEAKENYRALLITPDKIVAVSYPIKSVELRQKAVKFFGQSSEIDNHTNAPKFSKSEVQKTGKELYEIVFAPVAAKLKELGLKPDVLMWSLDSALRYLPVAALYDGRQYMAERYRNVVFTRSNSERMLAPVSPKWTGSGFYNSKEYTRPVNGEMRRFYGLENAKTEVEMIFEGPLKQGVIGGRFLSNEQFTKESLFTALKLHRPLVHIASHFQFEPGDASSSFLLLGDGTKLTIEDLKNAPDDLLDGVELLTLSACETGLQKERESDGREIDSFAELAQRKGAKAILASLWRVDDESTSQLMTRFYQTRESGKVTKVEALQKAQIKFLKNRDFSHPYYWAPFILIGNWR